MDKNNMSYIETTSLEEAIPELDILYMTRVQKERFDDAATYERLKDSYILNAAKLTAAKKNMSILHPLPRVNEISVDVDSDERACYFRQAANGKLMRMALILMLLNSAKNSGVRKIEGEAVAGAVCANGHCITTCEQELPQKFIIENSVVRCAYCEQILAK